MKKYSALIGMNYEEIELSDEEYNMILAYGKLLSNDTFIVDLKDGGRIESSYIDDIKLVS